MERKEYDELVGREIAGALERLDPRNPERARAVLQALVVQVEAHARAYYLLGLKTAEDLTDEFDVSRARMRALAQNRHERFGIGRKIANTWVWAPDEIETLRPGETGRPANPAD